MIKRLSNMGTKAVLLTKDKGFVQQLHNDVVDFSRYIPGDRGDLLIDVREGDLHD